MRSFSQNKILMETEHKLTKMKKRNQAEAYLNEMDDEDDASAGSGEDTLDEEDEEDDPASWWAAQFGGAVPPKPKLVRCETMAPQELPEAIDDPALDGEPMEPDPVQAEEFYPGLTVPPGWIWRADDKDMHGKGSNPYETEGDVWFGADHTVKSGYRDWFGTCNNPSKNEAIAMLTFYESVQWAVCGLEIGEEGTRHLQFSFRVKSLTQRSAIAKKPCFKRCWLAPRKGDDDQNITYCSKGGHFLVFHPERKQVGQGKRMDLLTAGQIVQQEGIRGVRRIANEQPDLFVRNYRGLGALAAMMTIPRKLNTAPTVICIYGESGSGKSTLADRLATEACAGSSDLNYYQWESGMFPWFEGYEGQKVMVCQEFRIKSHAGVMIPKSSLLTMWDRFQMKVNVKGASADLQCDTFIFTQCNHPCQWFPDTHEDPNVQLLRRVTRVIRCYKEGDEFKTEEMGNGEDSAIPIFVQP